MSTTQNMYRVIVSEEEFLSKAERTSKKVELKKLDDTAHFLREFNKPIYLPKLKMDELQADCLYLIEDIVRKTNL